MPVSVYSLSNGKCAITGGYIYRGTSYPNFTGKYFFADFCSNEIGILTDNGSSWSQDFQTPNITNFWSTFGEDNNGELYIAGGGRVYKLSDPNLSIEENSIERFKLFPNPSDGEITIQLASNFNNAETVSIINIQGQIVETINTANQIEIKVSTEALASGV